MYIFRVEGQRQHFALAHPGFELNLQGIAGNILTPLSTRGSDPPLPTGPALSLPPPPLVSCDIPGAPAAAQPLPVNDHD